MKTHYGGYEAQRPELAHIENSFGTNVLSRYYYTVDEVGRRSAAVISGSAFDVGTTRFDYDYNEKSELLDARRGFESDGTTHVKEQYYQYRYDQIGNRIRSDLGKSDRQFIYTANNVNQYTERLVPNEFPIIGSVSSTSEVVQVNDETAFQYEKYYSAVVAVTNSSAAQYKKVVVDSSSSSTTGRYFVAKTPEVFTYDDDGNMTSDGRFSYKWNAENRLVEAETLSSLPASVPRVKLAMDYDDQGRRIARSVSDWDGGAWVSRETRRFIYDDWNLVGETRTLASGSVSTNWYVWGLDLGGTLQGAGGVGGLLYADFNGNSHNYYAFDGGGNISEMVGTNGVVTAHYEYDPFGNIVFEEGSLADVNPFRFSTKYWDADAKLAYYGYRYFSPGMGRWLSRDPIEEWGGINLYGFCQNNPVNLLDPFGLAAGDPYPSPMQAGVQAGKDYGGIFQWVERAGLIYQKRNSYYYTPPAPLSTSTHLSSQPGAAYPLVPDSATIIGSWHTHPILSNPWLSPEDFIGANKFFRELGRDYNVMIPAVGPDVVYGFDPNGKFFNKNANDPSVPCGK